MENEKAKVLIVEDEIPIGESLKQILDDEGYKSFWAKNGFEAFQVLAENPDVKGITLDLLMPKISGYEFLHDLADKKFDALHHIPITIVSAMTNARTIAIQKGHRFLAKPVELKDYIREVAEMVDQKAA